MDYRELSLAVAQSALALFIIIDAPGGLPVFMGLVRGMEPRARGRTVNLGVAVAVLILFIFATLGRRLLGLFGVGIPEMMVAGGLMLAVLGLDEIFAFIPDRSGCG